MGNSQNSVKDALKDFKFTGNKYRSAYGNFKLLLNPATGEKIAVKALVSDKFKEIEDAYNVALVLQESKNRFFLSTTGYLSSSTNLCSNFHKLSIYVEYIELTLADAKLIDFSRSKEIIDDKQSRAMNLNDFDATDRIYPRDFSESDYLRIIFCVTSGLSFLHENHRYHGCINPWNILEVNGSFKIGDHLLLNGVTCFQDLMSQPNSKCFIAPELFICLPQGVIPEETSQHKADIFALGMSILSLIKGLKPEIFYNFKTYSFNLNILQQHLQSIKFSYSEEFYELLCAMMDINPIERLSSVEILMFLNRVYGEEEFGSFMGEREVFDEKMSDRNSFNEGIIPLDTIREENHMQPPMEFHQDVNYIEHKPKTGDILFKFGKPNNNSTISHPNKPATSINHPYQFEEVQKLDQPMNLAYSQISYGSKYSREALRKSIQNLKYDSKSELNNSELYNYQPRQSNIISHQDILKSSNQNNRLSRIIREPSNQVLNGNSTFEKDMQKMRMNGMH